MSLWNATCFEGFFYKITKVHQCYSIRYVSQGFRSSVRIIRQFTLTEINGHELFSLYSQFYACPDTSLIYVYYKNVLTLSGRISCGGGEPKYQTLAIPQPNMSPRMYIESHTDSIWFCRTGGGEGKLFLYTSVLDRRQSLQLW